MPVGEKRRVESASAVACSFGCCTQVGTSSPFQETGHLNTRELVDIAMALFELLEFLMIFSDHLWVVYVWHAFIVPLMRRIGIRKECRATDIDVVML